MSLYLVTVVSINTVRVAAKDAIEAEAIVRNEGDDKFKSVEHEVRDITARRAMDQRRGTCEAAYGDGDGTSICHRPEGHPSYAHDGVGHSPWPTKSDL